MRERDRIHILHISDLHFSSGETKQGKNYIQKIRDNDIEGWDTEKDFVDYIVVSGDISHYGVKEGFSNATIFLNELSQVLNVQKNNVLITPGNHDIVFSDPVSWDNFLQFSSSWYSTNYQELKDIVRVEEKNTPDGDSKIIFAIFNSVKDMSKISSPGYIGPEQRGKIRNEIRQIEKNHQVAGKIAVLHHHILPILGNSVEFLNRRYEYKVNILNDSPEMINFLIENGFDMALHGHFHKNFFSAITYPVKTKSFRKDVSIIGAGCLTCDPKRLQLSEPFYNFQLIQFNLYPSGFYEPRIILQPFNFRNERWKKGRKIDYPYSISVLHEKIYEREKFFGDYNFLKEDQWDFNPDKWFWSILSETRKKYSFSLDNVEQKEKFLVALVENIRIWNQSRKYVFTAIPLQLDGIYSFTSMFFTPDEITYYASKEFEKNWKELIDILQSKKEKPENYSHLDWANTIIGDRVSFYYTNLIEKKGLEEIFILEGGFGGLKTIVQLLTNLSSDSHRIFNESCIVRYRGIDIAHELYENAESIVQKTITEEGDHDEYLKRIKELYSGTFKLMKPYDDDDDEACLFKEGDLHKTVLDLDFRTKYKGKIDIIVVSYMMHHNFNGHRLFQSIKRGIFFKILEELKFKLSDYFSIAPQILKDKNIRFLEQSLQNILNQKNPTRKEKVYENLKKAIRNNQLEIYTIFNELLKPGGILAIADPNGFSRSFNRKIIFDQPRIAIANFSDIKICLKDLLSANFKRFEVWRQIRMRDDTIINLPYLNDINQDQEISEKELEKEEFDIMKHNKGEFWEKLMKDFGKKYEESLSDILEIDDPHLGYIILARK